MQRKPFRIGSDVFENIRKNNCYFVDKSLFIKDILSIEYQVVLITRPRRFGKSTNMSMLKSFMDISDKNQDLFSGLLIENERDIMEKWYKKVPVIHLSLSEMAAAKSYESSLVQLSEIISEECRKLEFLQQSEKISKSIARELSTLENLSLFEGTEIHPVPYSKLLRSLKTLTSALRFYYDKKVVVLIDEYDAPVNHDDQRSFRKALLSDLSAFFGGAFKGNPNVERVIVTGCLRIANESIFTGANNPGVFTVKDVALSSCFGLSECEVKQVLIDVGHPEKLDEAKEWYNGYNFGKTMVYNISDVLCYASALAGDPTSRPENYWAQTSSNDILMKSFESPHSSLSIYKLIAGEDVAVGSFDDNIAFDDIGMLDSVWNILYHTGYITSASGKTGVWRIPNNEIRGLFEQNYARAIRKSVGNEKIEELKEAVFSLDPGKIEKKLGSLLLLLNPKDTAGSHEQVYHVYFFGLLLNLKMTTNEQAGYGFSDVQVLLDEIVKLAVIFEFKVFDGSKGDKTLEDTAQRALRQIHGLDYPKNLMMQGYDVACFGVGCLSRDCAVKGD
ncbi:MAG: ATP-binding protein [Clostridiales bacterium]|nr:ATP-binding protein [Clostridiales bacterium]